MISNYLTSKKLFKSLNPKIDLDSITKDESPDGYYNLNNNFNADYILCDNFFTDKEIEEIILLGNLLPEKRGYLDGQNLNFDLRRTFCSWIPINEHTKWIYRKMSDLLKNVNEEHFNFDLTKIECLQFTKYYSTDSGFYVKHIDKTHKNSPENRKLSFVLQLSSPSDYEGGDLVIHTGNTPQNIKKGKGTIAFFPSYVLHEVTPVKKGIRYTLVGWVCGPTFK
jgi:PKHD-type hydroxylase